jgi:Alpha/beta hydrolase family
MSKACFATRRSRYRPKPRRPQAGEGPGHHERGAPAGVTVGDEPHAVLENLDGSGRAMRRTVSLLLVVASVMAWPALAETADDYGFPFADPLEATVLGTPPAYRAELPEEVPSRVHQLLVHPRRPIPEIFWYTARFEYSLAAQPGRAPLVFVIPGTGADHDSAKTLIMQRILYKAGLHVVSLTSPVHPNFIVSASSTSVPGLITEDAEDLYRVMRLVHRQIGRRIDVSEFYLAGYSLGATQAAFVARLDDQHGIFDFDKVLLINPPVSLYDSARILDGLFDDNIRSEADFNALFNSLMAALAGAFQQTRATTIDEDVLYTIFRTNRPDDATLEALIGVVFRFVGANLSFSTDVLSNAGFMVPRNVEPSITDSLTPYLRVGLFTTFEEYAREILYPAYRARHPEIGFQDMIEASSLQSIGEYLAGNPKIGLMHNRDDITLAPGDLDFLIEIFGERAQIYPRGGHNGNLEYRDNVADIIAFFKS